MRNVTTELAAADQTKITFEPWPINARAGASAIAADLDLDGRPTSWGCPAVTAAPGETPVPAWARNEGKRLARRRVAAGTGDARGWRDWRSSIWSATRCRTSSSSGRAQPPALARNLGNGHHWLALQLGGHWRVKPELMRTNSHAIGTRVIVEGQGIRVPTTTRRPTRAWASRSRRSCSDWASASRPTWFTCAGPTA